MAVIYRLASAIANTAYPVRFRWYRAMPLDAAVTLPGGGTIGIVRQGPLPGPADRSQIPTDRARSPRSATF